MSGWWVADFWNSPHMGPAFVIAWAFWVILSITLHELSHGWVAIRMGDRTPIETGHMSFNPLTHMGGASLLAFALIGIAWGAMPVNPSRMRGKYGDAIVSLAGPAMNALLALLSLTLFILWMGLVEGRWTGTGIGLGDSASANMQTFFTLGIMLNILLCVFNLIPIMPLDGGHILASFSPAYRRLFQSQVGPAIALGALLLLVMFAGRVVFPMAVDVTDWLIHVSFGALGLLAESGGVSGA